MSMSNVAVWGVSSVILTAILATAGCRSETTYASSPEIRIAEREMAKVSHWAVYRDGKRIGSVEVFRLIDADSNDANDRSVSFVADTTGSRIGYVTDDHRAYRYMAHGPADLVGNQPELAANVMAIFSIYEGKIELEKQIVKD